MNGTGSITLTDFDLDDELDPIDVTIGHVRVSLNEKGRVSADAKLGIESSVLAVSAEAAGLALARPRCWLATTTTTSGHYLRHRIAPQRACPYHHGARRRRENRGVAAKLRAASRCCAPRLRRHRSRMRYRFFPRRRIAISSSQQRRRNVRRCDGRCEVERGRGLQSHGGRADGLRQSARSRSAAGGRRSCAGVVPQYARRHISGCSERGRAAGRRRVSCRWRSATSTRMAFVDLFLGRQGATGTLLLNERSASFRARWRRMPRRRMP